MGLIDEVDVIDNVDTFSGRSLGTSLSRTTSGLLVFDDFVEPGTGTEAVGNDWTVLAASSNDPVVDRDNDWLKDVNTGNNQTIEIGRDDPAPPSDLIVTATLRSTQNDDSGTPALAARRDGVSPTEGYLFQARHAQGAFVLDVVSDAVEGESSSGSDSTFTPNEDYQVRGVVEESGADVLLRMYTIGGDPATNLSTPNADPNKGDLSLLVSHTDVGGVAQQGNDFYGIRIHDLGRAYFFLACGRNVQVTGLPTGYKAQLDDGTAVVESGGTATIDVDTIGLPAQTIKVLDASDVEQTSLTPSAITGRQGAEYSGGIVGGDIFTVS